MTFSIGFNDLGLKKGLMEAKGTQADAKGFQWQLMELLMQEGSSPTLQTT